jgi:parvulin-like peptidyl-prolyl isomerase
MATIVPVRRLLLLGLLAVLVAACGSSAAKNAATVAGTPIPASRVDVLMNAAEVAYKKNGQTFPAKGTSPYLALRDRAITYLVVAEELEQRAARQLGVRITDAQVAAEVKRLTERDYGGSDEKLSDTIAAQGMTRAEFDEEQRLTLTRDAVAKKIGAGATVTEKEIRAYYDSHKSTFKAPTHRQIREIRVQRVELARTLYGQLKQGADFAALARKYTLDKSIASKGGEFTAIEKVGNVEVNRTAFSLRLNEVSQPFPTVHGWHIVKAIGPLVQGKQAPLARVAPAIRRALGNRNKATRVSEWVDGTTREYCRSASVKYAKGYEPVDDPCSNVN